MVERQQRLEQKKVEIGSLAMRIVADAEDKVCISFFNPGISFHIIKLAVEFCLRKKCNFRLI